MEEYTNRELGILLKNLASQVKNGFKGTHERHDKTNGNVIKNTEFRQNVEGIIGSAKFIGFANIIMMIALFVGSILIGIGYFDKPLSDKEIENIGEYIILNTEIIQFD